jgi:hypothetical protein
MLHQILLRLDYMCVGPMFCQCQMSMVQLELGATAQLCRCHVCLWHHTSALHVLVLGAVLAHVVLAF